jgi:hypothetical protein
MSSYITGSLTEAAERDLWLLLDALDANVRAKGLTGLRTSPEADDATFTTFCNPADARGMLDDLEARCDVDVTECRTTYDAWLAAYCLPSEFARILRDELGNRYMREIVARNAAEADSRVCHSHDFIDANIVMAEAFERVMGREADTQDGADLDLFNGAWDAAKASGFAVQS